MDTFYVVLPVQLWIYGNVIVAVAIVDAYTVRIFSNAPIDSGKRLIQQPIVNDNNFRDKTSY